MKFIFQFALLYCVKRNFSFVLTVKIKFRFRTHYILVYNQNSQNIKNKIGHKNPYNMNIYMKLCF